MLLDSPDYEYNSSYHLPQPISLFTFPEAYTHTQSDFIVKIYMVHVPLAKYILNQTRSMSLYIVHHSIPFIIN